MKVDGILLIAGIFLGAFISGSTALQCYNCTDATKCGGSDVTQTPPQNCAPQDNAMCYKILVNDSYILRGCTDGTITEQSCLAIDATDDFTCKTCKDDTKACNSGIRFKVYWVLPLALGLFGMLRIKF